MAVELLFFQEPTGSTPVHLVFGAYEEATAIPGVIGFSLAGPVPSIEGSYEAGVGLGALGASAGASWEEAAPLQADDEAAWATNATLAASVALPSRQGQPLPAEHATPWQSNEPLSKEAQGLPWNAGQGADVAARAPWEQGVPLRRQASTAYADGEPVTKQAHALPWRGAARLPDAGFALPWRRGAAQNPQTRARWRQASAMRPTARMLWAQGIYLPTHGGPLLPPPEPPEEVCYEADAHLVFRRPAVEHANLLFVCDYADDYTPPGSTLVIPVREVYIVTNTLQLTRVSDGAPIPADSATIKLDADSWTWGFTAQVPGHALPLLDAGGGAPVELLLAVNGMAFRVRAENISRNRVFGRSGLTVRGRGRNAILGAPDAPILTHANAVPRNAAQLADDALTLGGVPIGWSVDWDLDDWLVPAGAWVMQGSPIDALQAIAAAGGGYVQPHPVDPVLRVLPRYAALPRDWGSLTPDVELPAAVVSVEDIEWVAKPAYNRVFVAGGDIGGRIGQVTIAGSGGDLAAPMVVDPLLTATAALVQRGRSILGDTGRQARVTLKVPALVELGLVAPGMLVRYVDGATTRLGLARSVDLTAKFGEAWQTIGVETHV